MNAPSNVATLSALMKYVQDKGFGHDEQSVETLHHPGIGDVTTVINLFKTSRYFYVRGVVQEITKLQIATEEILELTFFGNIKPNLESDFSEEMESRFELILPEREECYTGFPLVLLQSVIIHRGYHVMFEANSHELKLGKFFRRPSPLKQELEELISCKQDDMSFNTLGPMIWDTILKHGGLKILAELFQETIETDVFYEMRLRDPYCFDDELLFR